MCFQVHRAPSKIITLYIPQVKMHIFPQTAITLKVWGTSEKLQCQILRATGLIKTVIISHWLFTVAENTLCEQKTHFVIFRSHSYPIVFVQGNAGDPQMSEQGDEAQQSARVFSVWRQCWLRKQTSLSDVRCLQQGGKLQDANCFSVSAEKIYNYTFIQNWFVMVLTRGERSLAWLHIIWRNYTFTWGSACSCHCNIVFSGEFGKMDLSPLNKTKQKSLTLLQIWYIYHFKNSGWLMEYLILMSTMFTDYRVGCCVLNSMHGIITKSHLWCFRCFFCASLFPHITSQATNSTSAALCCKSNPAHC